jgi:hypothetical protein
MLSGRRASVCLVSAILLLLAIGPLAGCERAERIVEPTGITPQNYSTFPEFFLEKGTDADSSYISLRGLHKGGGILELQTTSWGIRETGPMLVRISAPKSATFLFLGRCGTVPTKTWEKVMLQLDLTAADQDTLERIAFTSHGDTLEIVKTHTLIRLRCELELLNTRGQMQTRFAVSDSIIFAFKLINSTGRELEIGMPNGGPFAQFQVQQDSVVLKDSFEGLAFPENAPRYPFPNNQIAAETWTLRAGELPHGEFVAVVIPKITIVETVERFPKETLPFTVE